MKTAKTALLLVLIAPTSAFAVKVTLFSNTATYVERAKDIVIARCESPAEVSGRPLQDGLDVWDFEVMRTLKGSIGEGSLRVVSLYPLEPSKTYMLYNMGGSAYGSDFLAIPQLSVVELPPRFDLALLDGKDVLRQADTLFAARLDRVKDELRRLQEEQKLLEQAVGDPTTP
jgi:hypothetical protein